MTSDPFLPGFAAFFEEEYALVQPRQKVTGDMILEYGFAVVGPEEWKPGFTEVWDLTFAKGVSVAPHEVQKLIAAEKEYADRLRGSLSLIITPRSLLLYAMSFYAYAMRPLGRRIQAVSTQEEAARVLGIEALPILPE